jgi:thiamine-monophosphate kinase
MVAVAGLGERGVIDLLREHLVLMPNMPVAFGDDVSAVSIGDGGDEVAVLKVDMLVAKTDVPANMSLYDAARKAVVMCVSDFASKGVQPVAALVALGLPKSLVTKESIVEIVNGLNAAAREYGAYIIGGDTGETGDLTISVSLYGKASRSVLMLRNGAKAGDILAVTGVFGKSSAGLRLLLDTSCVVSSKARLVLEAAVFNPKARLAEGLALSKVGCVSASMDSSDGLAWSLHELMHMSGVGFTVDNVPIAVETAEFAQQNGLNAETLALYGGEEYELVLTVPSEKWETAKKAVEEVGGNLIPIGRAIACKELVLQTDDGKKVPIKPCGYEHFTPKT